jgi:SAM-dependent methyltransferase
MRRVHLRHLICPACHGALRIVEASVERGDRIESGRLGCDGCGAAYPITRGVPRFVSADNYAAGFGLEWNRHARTQYDSQSGLDITRRRFFEQTGWPESMSGERILEAGSGSGRFTEQAAATGADIVSFDYSSAVDANYASNGGRGNVLIVQADVFAMPFAGGTFDRVFCFGMLQHTPDPRRAFFSLPPMLRTGGRLCADVYKATLIKTLLATKYYVRPFTRRMPPERLYAGIRRYVDRMWPLARRIRRVPRIGYAINWRLLVADYSFLGIVDDAQLKEWAYLDTFDMLAPRYDRPQRLRTFRGWFEAAGLRDIETWYSPHGIVGRGVRADG